MNVFWWSLGAALCAKELIGDARGQPQRQPALVHTWIDLHVPKQMCIPRGVTTPALANLKRQHPEVFLKRTAATPWYKVLDVHGIGGDSVKCAR